MSIGIAVKQRDLENIVTGEFYDVAVIGAGIRLTTTLKFDPEFYVYLERIYIDAQADSNYYIRMNGEEFETNEFRPSLPKKIEDGVMQLVIENVSASSKSYGREVVVYGIPRRPI